MEVEYAAEWAAKEQATSLATDMTELQTQTVLCSPSHIYIYITTTCHHLNHLFEGDPHIEGSQTCRYPHFTGS